MKRVALMIGMIFCFGFCVAVHAATLYDVDFGTPPHTIGNVPVVNGQSNTPSRINFGDPRVEVRLGELNDQPLVFNMAGQNESYDQIMFDIGAGYDNYSVGFDFSAENYVDSISTNQFVLLFDTPEVRNLYFKSNGNIDFWHPGGFHGTIGSFENNEFYRVGVDVDLLDESIAICLNDILLYQGEFSPSGDDLERLRFSFGKLGSKTGHDSVAIDNVLITGNQVPISGAIWLLGSGLIGIVTFRRRNKRIMRA